MSFDPLSAITGLVQTGLDKFLPDKMSEADRAKVGADMQQYIIQTGLQEDQDLRNFILQYEGKAEDVPAFITVIRSLIRPLITIIVTVAFVWGWLHPASFTPGQMEVLNPALLLCLFFWFGEKAVSKSGILEIFQKK